MTIRNGSARLATRIHREAQGLAPMSLEDRCEILVDMFKGVEFEVQVGAMGPCIAIKGPEGTSLYVDRTNGPVKPPAVMKLPAVVDGATERITAAVSGLNGTVSNVVTGLKGLITSMTQSEADRAPVVEAPVLEAQGLSELEALEAEFEVTDRDIAFEREAGLSDEERLATLRNRKAQRDQAPAVLEDDENGDPWAAILNNEEPDWDPAATARAKEKSRKLALMRQALNRPSEIEELEEKLGVTAEWRVENGISDELRYDPAYLQVLRGALHDRGEPQEPLPALAGDELVARVKLEEKWSPWGEGPAEL